MFTTKTAREEFDETREHIRSLITDEDRVRLTEKGSTTGIYLLYLDDFSDEHTLPIYVGRLC